ncbi:MAG: alpha/beta fold hydrolase [Candidatus Nanoarchaeia archaeon]
MDQGGLIVNGKEVKYLTKGEGEPLIFLHGYSCEPYYYSEMLEKLSQKYKVYAPRVYGLEPFLRNYSLEDYVEITKGFIQKLGESHPYIVGHSLGGAIAIRCSEEMSNIRGIVCINNLYPNKNGVHRFLGSYFKMISREVSGRYVPKEKKHHVRKKALSYLPPFLFNKFKAPGPLISHLREFGNFDFQKRVIEIPSLFLLSDKDEFFGIDKFSYLEDKFANYKCEVVRNRGHMWPAYEPEEISTKIIEFFNN